MKTFSINCVDKNKQPVGTQNVSMSNEKTDAHTITFYSQVDKQPIFTIDAEKGELTLDNSNGMFNEISTEQSVIKIKIKNVKMDYVDNLTFTIDGTKKTFRISGNIFEQKHGTTFTPVATFDSPLDIVLPTTLFADINEQKIKVDTLPFQMFSAFDESDKTLGIETFESADKSLHIIKINNQLYIGRGHKLVPVDINNQNFYRMGDKSVLGFTMGRKNGISGKQSSGIAFSLPENELLKVAEFINGSVESTLFKTEEDYNSNDIDYSKVNAQSDAVKVLSTSPEKEPIVTGLTGDGKPSGNPTNDDVPTDDLSGDPTDGGTPDDDKPKDDTPTGTDDTDDTEKEKTGDDSSSDKKPKENNEKKNEESKGDGKKEEPKKDPKKSSIVITKDTCKVLAIIMGALLISGAVVAPWMFWLFTFFALASYTTETLATINFTETKKVSKADKIRDKLAKEKDKLAELEKLPETKRNLSKKNKLLNKIAKHEAYLGIHSEEVASPEKTDSDSTTDPIPSDEASVKEEESEDETKHAEDGVITPKEPIDKEEDAEVKPSDDATPKTPEEVMTEVIKPGVAGTFSEPIVEEETTKPTTTEEPEKEKSAEITSETTYSSFEGAKSKINSLLETIIANPETKQDNLQLIDKIIEQVCPDGKNADALEITDRETFDTFIEYRLSRMRVNGAEERVERAKINGDFLDSDQEDVDTAKHELNESIKNMYEATKSHEAQVVTTTLPATEVQHKVDNDERIK